MEESRKLRIKRLKKIIVILLLLFLLLPTILCVILFGKITSLEKQISGLAENRNREIQESVDNRNRVVEAFADNGACEVEEIEIQAQEQQAIDKFYFEEDFENQEQTGIVIEDVRKKVYLTFDDGPSQYTDEILDILKDYGVKATFFVVGKTEKNYEAIYRRIVEEGHTLGLHSYSHVYSEIYESIESYSYDLLKLQKLLEEVTGVSPNIVRFPGGSSNQVSKLNMQEYITYLDEINMTYFDWNVSSGEMQAQDIGVTQIVQNCTTALKNQNTSIILMHDIGNKPSIVEALPIIIEKIQEMENSVLLPITDGTIPIQHRIN